MTFSLTSLSSLLKVPDKYPSCITEIRGKGGVYGDGGAEVVVLNLSLYTLPFYVGSINSRCSENEPAGGTKTGLEKAAEIEPTLYVHFYLSFLEF